MSETLGGDAEYLGESAGRTYLMRGGGRVCKVFLPRDDDENRSDREIAALELLKESGIPAPRFLDTGELPDGSRWVLISQLPGQPIAIDDYEGPDGLRFQRLRGRFAAKIHSVRAPAFGVWTAEPGRSLRNYCSGFSERLATRASAARPERAALAGRLRQLQDRLALYFEGTPPVLVHGDLAPGNFLVTGSEVVGVIDWETAAGSTPAAEFAGPALWGDSGLHEFAAAYAEFGSLDPVTPERLSYFVIDHVLRVCAATDGRWNSRIDRLALELADRLLGGDLIGL